MYKLVDFYLRITRNLTVNLNDLNIILEQVEGDTIEALKSISINFINRYLVNQQIIVKQAESPNDEISKLKGTIEEKDKEIYQLNDTIKGYFSNVEKKDDESGIHFCNVLLAKEKTKNGELEGQIKTLNGAINQLEGQLKASNGIINDLSKSDESLKQLKSIYEVNEPFESATKEQVINHLSSVLKTKDANYARNMRYVTDLLDKEKIFNLKLQSQLKETKNNSEDCDLSKKKVDEQKIEIDKLKDIIIDLECARDESTETIKLLETERKTATDLVSELKKGSTAGTDAHLQSRIENLSREKADVNIERQKLQTRINQLEIDLKDRNGLIAKYVNEKRGSSIQNDDTLSDVLLLARIVRDTPLKSDGNRDLGKIHELYNKECSFKQNLGMIRKLVDNIDKNNPNKKRGRGRPHKRRVIEEIKEDQTEPARQVWPPQDVAILENILRDLMKSDLDSFLGPIKSETMEDIAILYNKDPTRTCNRRLSKIQSKVYTIKPKLITEVVKNVNHKSKEEEEEPEEEEPEEPEEESEEEEEEYNSMSDEEYKEEPSREPISRPTKQIKLSPIKQDEVPDNSINVITSELNEKKKKDLELLEKLYNNTLDTYGSIDISRLRVDFNKHPECYIEKTIFDVEQFMLGRPTLKELPRADLYEKMLS